MTAEDKLNAENVACLSCLIEVPPDSSDIGKLYKLLPILTELGWTSIKMYEGDNSPFFMEPPQQESFKEETKEPVKIKLTIIYGLYDDKRTEFSLPSIDDALKLLPQGCKVTSVRYVREPNSIYYKYKHKVTLAYEDTGSTMDY